MDVFAVCVVKTSQYNFSVIQFNVLNNLQSSAQF